MSLLKKGIFIVLCLIQSGVFANTNEPEEVWLSAQLNNLKETATFLFLQQDNKLLMSVKDWQYWHLKPPDAASVKYQDEDYYILDGMQGVSYHINSQELTVNITADVALFQNTQLSGIRPQAAINYDNTIGAFLNYDLSSAYSDSGHEVKHTLFGEAAGFNSLGALESQFVVTEPDKSNREFTRLNTTWISDNPQTLHSLILGDSSTTSVGWGSVRFAGVKWGTNYTLQPSMVKTPLLSLQGVAQMPSTVDVFINNIRSMSQKIPTGAFSIDNIPVISGDGQVRMVVTDMLGQEQVITQPYYMSAELLQTGLAEYSYELGVTRENYGIDNANYGASLAIASYRRGLTPYLTGELHGQLLQQQQTLHLGSDFLIPHWGAMKLAVAHSWHEQSPNGYAWNINTSYQSASRGVGGQIQQQSRYFSAVDTYGVPSLLQSRIQLFANTSLGLWGAASINYIKQQDYDAQETSFIQVGYNNKLWKGIFNAVASQTLSSSKKTVFKLGVSIPLWAKHSLSLSGTPQNNQYSMSMQHSMPAGQGVGYQVSVAESSGQKQYQAAISGQNNVLSSQLRITRANQQTGLTSSIRGGLVMLDKQIFVTRAVSQSFALVNVGDYANVGVYRQNQLIGKTNAKGNVLATGLMPYQANKLSINAADLPLDAQINTASVEVYPKYKSGLYVNFDVKRSYAATMTILLDNGQPLPAGAEVYKQDDTEVFPVGFRGELYITGLSAKNSLTAEWKGQKCTFEVAFVMVDDSLPDLGNYLCKGVAP